MSITTPTMAELVRTLVNNSPKLQKDIAAEAGFENPNVITMIKQGLTKLPLEKVGPLAKALDVDPVELLIHYFREYKPETWAAISPYFEAMLTHDELEIVRALRHLSGGPYIAGLSDQSKKALSEFLASVRETNTCH